MSAEHRSSPTFWLVRRRLRRRRWRALALVVTLAVASMAVVLPAGGGLPVVCGLAVAHATLGSTRALAPELRQQAALGLLPGEILRHLLAEVALLALVAGALGTLLAGPVAAAVFDGAVSWPHALLAVPAALATGLVAAGAPTGVAAHSGGRLPRVRLPRVRLPIPHGRGRLRAAFVQLSRTPGRGGVLVAAVAVGCGSLTTHVLAGFDGGGTEIGVTALVVAAASSVVAEAGRLAVRDHGGELADLRIQGLLRVQVAGLIVRELSIPVFSGMVLGCAFSLAAAAMPGSFGMS